MIYKKYLKFLWKFGDTLNKTSLDDHDNGTDEYMTDSELDVINFDSVKTWYAKDLHLSESPKSCDALFIRNDSELYLIEFKNGCIDNSKNFEVKGKLYDSILILLDIINKGISYSRENINFILVYNENRTHTSRDFNGDAFDMMCSESLYAIERSISRLAEEPFVQFGLNRFKKIYFKSVFTYTKQQFEREFVQKYTN